MKFLTGSDYRYSTISQKCVKIQFFFWAWFETCTLFHSVVLFALKLWSSCSLCNFHLKSWRVFVCFSGSGAFAKLCWVMKCHTALEILQQIWRFRIQRFSPDVQDGGKSENQNKFQLMRRPPFCFRSCGSCRWRCQIETGINPEIVFTTFHLQFCFCLIVQTFHLILDQFISRKIGTLHFLLLLTLSLLHFAIP